MEDNLSMSVYLNKYPKNRKIAIKKMSPAIWIPSSKITRCYNCKELFTLFRRKHHCRVCGRVFCADCANNWGKIPSLVNTTTPPYRVFSLQSIITEDLRMCVECKDKIDFIKDYSKFIYIFSYLPIDIKVLYKLREVNHEWCRSINTILSSYKSSQYKLPVQSYSKLEKQFYWNHRYEFSQHFSLMYKCINSFKKGDNIEDLKKLMCHYKKKEKTHSCKELVCKRNCSVNPKIEEILVLFNNNAIMAVSEVKEWIFQKLKNFDKNEIKLIMPWLIKLGLQNSKTMCDYIIPFVVNDLQLGYSFYFECKIYEQDSIYKQKLKFSLDLFNSKFGEKNIKEIKKTNRFIKFINSNINVLKTPEEWRHESKLFFDKYKYILLPWDINILCTGLMEEGIMCFNSATKPWKIPLIVVKDKEEQIINVLVKSEDVRKDKLTMIVSKMLQRVCENIIDIKTYNVFPINDSCGWIEMVEKSNTLYDIKYKYQTTIQNYIMDLNPNVTVGRIRENFIQTCVSSCVLCYVLGVGDRHMENIMVTRNGKLLHIDFSYLLGDDPKRLNIEMKITEDMLNMLGGSASETFNLFKIQCKEAYKKIRLRSSLWYILLTYLVFSVPSIDYYKYNEEMIKNHVIERLVPGEKDSEASMQIIDIVERSSRSNWGENIAEWSHSIGNELRKIKDNFTLFNLEM